MPFYSLEILTPPSSEKETELVVEGDYIKYAEIRFPRGPKDLLLVGIFYGIKKIYPFLEDEWINGDDEKIPIDDPLPLPETPCRLIIKTVNNDTQYEHRVFVRITTAFEKKEEIEWVITPEGFYELRTPKRSSRRA
jgi:hypothetical protein